MKQVLKTRHFIYLHNATIRRQAVVAATALCMTGCATAPGQNGLSKTFNDTFNNPDPCSNNARNTGLLIGGLAGTLLGAKLGDKDKGAMLAGALLGGSIGGMIGSDIDERRCALAKVAREYDLQMSFAAVTDNGAVMSDAAIQHSANPNLVKKNAIGNVMSLRDGAAEGGHFNSNSAELTTRAERYFSAIADVYNLNQAAQAIADPAQRQRALQSNAQRRLLLVGHTDDTGASSSNAQLSERRARAVAEYLERRGIPRDQVYYQGAGEIYPVADNNSDAGRSQNRRVEIVELADDASLSKYLDARRPNYQFYRAVEPAPVLAVADAPSLPRASATPMAAHQADRRARSAASSAGDKTDGKAQASKRVAPGSGTVKPGAGSQPSTSAVASAARAAPAKGLAHTNGPVIDFGGIPLEPGRAGSVVASVGPVEKQRALFALISSAYADEVPSLSDCSQDRPRNSGAVRALKDGATYKVKEHVPGLYGRTWTAQVNGHQVVINKVAVLANEASLAQIPELKIYANYDPVANRDARPAVAIRPEVNTYLGEKGILYRVFAKGSAGMQCIDVVFNRNGGTAAKDGNIVYARSSQLYISPFKPVIAN